jgi:hypothetical protein
LLKAKTYVTGCVARDCWQRKQKCNTYSVLVTILVSLFV